MCVSSIWGNFAWHGFSLNQSKNVFTYTKFKSKSLIHSVVLQFLWGTRTLSFTNTHTHIHTYTHTNTHTDTHTYTHTHTHTHTQIHTHMHTHTQIQKSIRDYLSYMFRGLRLHCIFSQFWLYTHTHVPSTTPWE
jgi:hypothetical protein